MRGRMLLTVLAAAVAVPVFSIQAQAADPTRYVAIGGVDNATCSHDNPCQHIQHAVDVAAPGDRILIGPGTYGEQVLIGKDLTVDGQGVGTTTIKAPDLMNPDAGGQTYVVELGAAAALRMSRLTVSGPGAPGGGTNCAPNPLSLDKGIKVTEGATLDLRDATVRDIYDVPDSGCQRGDAISIGTDCFTCAPAAVGHATIDHVLISRYQKNGVAVRGSGSALTLANTTVENIPSSVIASNGVEVLDGATGDVQHDRITGNECNLVGVCGPDLMNDTQASGFLSSGATASTVFAHNQVWANDIGIYTDDGIAVSHNDASGNRDADIFVDRDAGGAAVLHNLANGADYGIYVANGNVGGNRFEKDSAHGNSVVDLYLGAGNGPDVFKDNSCGTAFPDKQTWDCK